jgi:hypothetical protein
MISLSVNEPGWWGWARHIASGVTVIERLIKERRNTGKQQSGSRQPLSTLEKPVRVE